MTRINVLCLAFVFVLNMVEQEVSGSRCRCTKYCSIKRSQTSYYYKKCGFLWLRRCKKSYTSYSKGYYCCRRGCPENGGWSSWYSWSSFGSCSKTCGYGTKKYKRKRYCNNPYPKYGGRGCYGSSTTYSYKSCLVRSCPIVNGRWGSWYSWSSYGSCSKTCGYGTKKYKRKRYCNNPTPANGGRGCYGSSTTYSYKSCLVRSCPIVNGMWGSWYSWSSYGSCSKTCGNGTKKYKRKRYCNNPSPKNGGRGCYGSSTTYSYKSCLVRSCPIVNGGWTSWTSWHAYTPCSRTCGSGSRSFIRWRYCTNPSPQNGGRTCNGASVARNHRSCFVKTCPVDGGWGSWNSWSSYGYCSQTCGYGTKKYKRWRYCNRPYPKIGGKDCCGSSTEYTFKQCHVKTCPVNGAWSFWNSWSSYGSCSKTCGYGTKKYKRKRYCNNPYPKNAGRGCYGSSMMYTYKQCHVRACPVIGGWTSWSSWHAYTPCSKTCGNGSGSFIRWRYCTNPTPKNGGRTCKGASVGRIHRSCFVKKCPVNGGWTSWGSWSAYSSCSSTCGAGSMTYKRTRNCKNPSPRYGGSGCCGLSREYSHKTCLKQNCPVDGHWKSWSSWSAYTTCSMTCGSGSRNYKRTRQCTRPKNGGKQCSGSSKEIIQVHCFTRNCPVHGGWTSWSNWSAYTSCSTTCGSGSRNYKRTRQCINPKYGGKQCSGLSSETTQVHCFTKNCPVHGGWTSWSSWSTYTSCSTTCGSGSRSYKRTRQCTPPKFGGKKCSGLSNETIQVHCFIRNCPVNGGWTSWSSWSGFGSCSKLCGAGTKMYNRTRLCSNPSPTDGGKTCKGLATESSQRKCLIKTCPVDGYWLNWGNWSHIGQCTVSCGGGNRTEIRTRSCKQAQFGGKPCVGKFNETRDQSCNEQPCQQDGQWSSWSIWKNHGECSATCGMGDLLHVRTRACNNPPASNGGKECVGNKTETISMPCLTKPCSPKSSLRCSEYGNCGCTYGFFGNGFMCKGSLGKRFLLLFMETNPLSQSDEMENRSTEIYVAALADSNITLDSASQHLKFLPFSNKVISHGVSSIKIPKLFKTIDSKIEKKAILLESSSPVSVVTMNQDGNSSDTSLILPIERLGRSYIIGSTDPFSPKLPAHKSQVAIAALHDNTTVTIQLKFESNSSLTYLNTQYFSGDNLTLSLNQFESFQFCKQADLTGTLVGADRPVAVFAGNRCNKLQTFGYCSHLMEQLPPIDDLDNEYIVPPSLEFGGSKIRIIAAETTRIQFFFDGEKRENVIDPGTYKDVRIYSDHSAYIKTDKPIMVLSFAIRMTKKEEGDPYMSLVPGFNQFLSKYFVAVPEGYTKNFLSVILKADSKSSLRIDGEGLSRDIIVSEMKVMASDVEYLVFILQISAGGHKVETLDNSRFGLMIHGQTKGDSYGYAANMVKVS
uniref:SCO-spondin-like isoform X2 n=1 Tax=Crassostrea virginica TaxID=6565 RepID=A0A8B8BA01_CRAVI|nr:SCO-spondin-like isoform X2 [Crassostrea virginica]